MLSILQSPYFFLGALVCFLIWFGWLTFLVLRDRKIYNKLLTGNEAEGIKKILDGLRNDIDRNRKHIDELEKNLAEEKQKSDKYLQKVGFLRFNPFEDTGGQQSFVVSILDREKSGVVISSLFGRNGTRWFAKKVIRGVGERMELTEEEKKTIV